MRSTMSLLFGFFASVVTAASPVASPSITITPTRLTVVGVTPGADVLFFGAGFEPKGTYAITHRWSTVVPDSDSDGTVSYELDPAVKWNALWIIADLRNGHYIVASTPGFPIMREHLTRREFKRDLSGAVARFVY